MAFERKSWKIIEKIKITPQKLGKLNCQGEKELVKNGTIGRVD